MSLPGDIPAIVVGCQNFDSASAARRKHQKIPPTNASICPKARSKLASQQKPVVKARGRQRGQTAIQRVSIVIDDAVGEGGMGAFVVVLLLIDITWYIILLPYINFHVGSYSCIESTKSGTPFC
jgi:hypothetical protein